MNTIAPIPPVLPERRAAHQRSAAWPAVPSPAERASNPSPPASKAAIAFEAVVLRTFVEAMLPREGFGDGTAGHMWRGQMAEALADTLARSGGVGLARTIEGSGR